MNYHFSNLSYIPYGSMSKETPFVETPISIVRKVIELGNIKNNDIILDIGCGEGDFLIIVYN